MSEFKCRSCGGTLQRKKGERVGICDSCGNLQPMPRDQSDPVTRLYNEADRLRSVDKDYDRAIKRYEEILNEDPDEPEANWGVVLCMYGIQYAEDPVSGQRVPTLNRMQNVSVYDNAFYKKTIENAGDEEKEIYEKDAAIIDRIQKEYHAVASREKPYDVFISYKDKIDGTDQKTEDYAVAQKIYEGLIDRGLRVFFSDRSLRGKVGQYEPYIFAALESAKYMLVVGSKKEYFNAEWVRNEWSRYLQRIREGADKKIVPIYHHCDIRDIPTQLISKNQACDFNDVMAMGTLLETIVRDCERSRDKTGEVIKAQSAPERGNAEEGLKQRIFISLNGGDMDTARMLTEKVLNNEPAYAEGYLARIMLERNCYDRSQLGKGTIPLKQSVNYRNLMQFADGALAAEIQAYEQEIAGNIKKENKKKTVKGLLSIAFIAAAVLAGLYYFKILRPQQKLDKAKDLLEAGKYEEAYSILAGLGQSEMIKASKYDIAKTELAAGEYEGAYALLNELGDYQDAADLLKQSKLERAVNWLDEGKHEEAYAFLSELGDYGNAVTLMLDNKYERAERYAENGDYDAAIKLFDEIGEHRDGSKKAEETRQTLLDQHMAAIDEAQPGDCVILGHYEQDLDPSNGADQVEWIVLDKQEDKVLLLAKNNIDLQQFNFEDATTNWQICSLREWMNKTMYEELFDDTEKTRVILSAVSSETSAKTLANGNDTQDHLFLLSYDEVVEYMSLIPSPAVTPYAASLKQSASKESEFWLRTMADTGYPYRRGGDEFYYKTETTYYIGVRPAFWFDMSSQEAASQQEAGE